MNINRHNYEEYFILYMDNELNSTDRRMVESFVQNNPDLKDELDILLQSRLVPDNSIVFESKEELLKITNESIISLDNYEEWLILYVDNELSQEQISRVEKFISVYPQVQRDFEILQKTKLQPEEIIFPYKQSLYRRTEKVRVIQMKWWRVAAAAVLLLAIGTTAVLVINNKKHQEVPTAKTSNNDQQKIETKNPVPTLENKENKNTNESNNPKLANNIRVEKKSPQPSIQTIKPKKEEQQLANNNNDKSNNLSQPLDNPNVKTHENGLVIADNKIENIGITSPQTNNTLVTKHLPRTSDDGLTFASNQNDPSELEEGSDNKKSRGFFRKAVRFLEKRTGINAANDDDKVLIGGLAVKLK